MQLKETSHRQRKRTENCRQVIQECTARNATIEKNLRSTEVKFQEEKEKARQLEIQIEIASEDYKQGEFTTVGNKIAKVKGEDDPLSNFHICPIKAFNTKFKSVEHALQYKNNTQPQPIRGCRANPKVREGKGCKIIGW